MNTIWSMGNKEVFTRDLLRDFCLVYTTVIEQSQRFAHSGTISYAILRDLLGEAIRKGVFWRLKDTAHHLFRKKNDSQEYVSENLLDWCIGYAFHECCKLKEDAFQRQHYANRLLQLEKYAEKEIIQELKPYTIQTRESIGRELQRILAVLEQSRILLMQYMQTQGENGHVARFIVTEENLVKQSFGEHMPRLLHSLYGENTSHIYVLAAKASLEGGHPKKAKLFIEKAQSLNVDVTILQPLLNQWAVIFPTANGID